MEVSGQYLLWSVYDHDKESPIPTKGGKTLPAISPKEALGGEDVVSILKHVVADMSVELPIYIFSVQTAAETLDCLH